MSHYASDSDNTNGRCRIVLAGGPGGGKTTAADLFRREIGERVVVVHEAATLLFSGGFPRSGEGHARRSAQRAVYHVQRNLEDVQSALYPERVLLCDRGTIDGAAYWPGDPAGFFEAVGSTREHELGRYDSVIFFESAAVGGMSVEGLRIRGSTVHQLARRVHSPEWPQGLRGDHLRSRYGRGRAHSPPPSESRRGRAQHDPDRRIHGPAHARAPARRATTACADLGRRTGLESASRSAELLQRSRRSQRPAGVRRRLRHGYATVLLGPRRARSAGTASCRHGGEGTPSRDCRSWKSRGPRVTPLDAQEPFVSVRIALAAGLLIGLGREQSQGPVAELLCDQRSTVLLPVGQRGRYQGLRKLIVRRPMRLLALEVG